MTDTPHNRERDAELREILAEELDKKLCHGSANMIRKSSNMVMHELDAALTAMRRISIPIPLTPSDGLAKQLRDLADDLDFAANAGKQDGYTGKIFARKFDAKLLRDAADCISTKITPSDEMVVAAFDATVTEGFPVSPILLRAALTAALNLMGGDK